jgi:hypothetical protein
MRHRTEERSLARSAGREARHEHRAEVVRQHDRYRLEAGLLDDLSLEEDTVYAADLEPTACALPVYDADLELIGNGPRPYAAHLELTESAAPAPAAWGSERVDAEWNPLSQAAFLPLVMDLLAPPPGRDPTQTQIIPRPRLPRVASLSLLERLRRGSFGV